jgi:hypothetical protein
VLVGYVRDEHPREGRETCARDEREGSSSLRYADAWDNCSGSGSVWEGEVCVLARTYSCEELRILA